MPNPVVALAMPHRSHAGVDMDALVRGVAAKATTSGGLDVCPARCWTSLIPYTFNTLWAGFLNMRQAHGLRYFAMIHDDVKPDPGWLDVLVGELEATGADLVSAVVPIKDARGLTSTAVDDTGDEWSPRRLAMREVFALPETFGAGDVGGRLLVNSGLWVCRFDRLWCEMVYFRQQDRLIRTPDEGWVPQTMSEDWDFSRQVATAAGTVLATRKVGLDHERPEWTNRRPWGLWERDRDCDPDHRPRVEVAAA